MNELDRAIEALIPIPSCEALTACSEAKLLEAMEWVGRWYREIDTELKRRYAALAQRV